jgi:hypothetical protein
MNLNLNIELVQALIVLASLLVESGFFYLVVRKVYKHDRLEAGLMTIGLTLLFFVMVWLCKWGSDIRWSVVFWAAWLGLCWVWGVRTWFRTS